MAARPMTKLPCRVHRIDRFMMTLPSFDYPSREPTMASTEDWALRRHCKGRTRRAVGFTRVRRAAARSMDPPSESGDRTGVPPRRYSVVESEPAVVGPESCRVRSAPAVPVREMDGDPKMVMHDGVG